MSNEFEQSADLRPGLFPEETAEEAVARIVAQNPQKHGVTVEERIARAKAWAARMTANGHDLSGLSAEDALIVSVGGNPNEMMVGNKPRWTVDGDTIKDHLEGKEYGVVAISAVPTITLDDIERIKTEGPEAVLGPPDVVLPGICAHSWPEDPDEDTRCPLCQMTFADWVNS